MKLVLFLSFVLILPFIGCQRDKMNSKNLTTVNVKRNLPVSLSGNTVSLDTIRQKNSQDNNNTTIASNVKISPSRQETGKQARVLNRLLFDDFLKLDGVVLQEKLKEYVGHTPIQVAAGAILGILIAFILDPMFI